MAMMVEDPHDAVMTTAGTPNAGMTTPPTITEPYKLRRARQGRMLAGVAAGLATASGLDVTVVRICLGLSVVTGWGLGVLAYFLLWIVIPEEQPSRGRSVEPAPESTARIIRYVLIGGALLMVLQSFGGIWPQAGPHNDFGGLLGFILLCVGAGVLISRYRSDAWAPAGTTTDAAPPPSESFTPWTAPGATPPTDDDADELDDDPDRVSFVGPLRDVATTVHRDVTSALADARIGTDAPRKPGGAALGWARVLGWFLLLWWSAGLLVLIGLWRVGAVDVSAPGILFGVSGLAIGFVLNGLIRIRKPALVLASLLALLVPTGAVLGAVRADGPAGDRILRPLSAPAVSNYRVSVGKLELDLSSTRLATSRPTRINARVGTGAMVITIPDNVSATVVTRVGVGGYAVLGRETDTALGQRETLRFEGCEGAPHLQLFLRGGATWIEVQRENGISTATCESAATASDATVPVTPTTAPVPTPVG